MDTEYNTDKYINKQLNIEVLKDVYPNTITLLGMIVNYFLYYYYFVKKNIGVLSFLIIFRMLLDNLDGIVARHFNKTSKLGGFYDSITDSVFTYIISYIILHKFKVKYSLYISIALALIQLGYLICFDGLFLHSNMEKIDESKVVLTIIPNLITNNTYFVGLILILLINLKI